VGEAFNFSMEQPRTVIEMVRQVLRAAGRDDLQPVVLGGADDEIPAQYLSSAKARAALDWVPEWDIDAALAETVAWYDSLLRPAVAQDGPRG
jgi:CDP-glucose 4,6-dehydratase